MQGPDFDLDFKPAHGEAVTVADGVQRITVNNPGPFTFHGTNSYIVGNRSVAVIDPGPEDEAHFQALMSALRGREVTHIAVSHTHRDHSPLARRLKAATGAAIVGEGPHRAARPLHEGEINPFAESSDMDFSPDIILADGGRIEGDGWALTGLATPATPPTTWHLRSTAPARSFPQTTSWPGRRRSSHRRMAPWQTTWPRWKSC